MLSKNPSTAHWRDLSPKFASEYDVYGVILAVQKIITKYIPPKRMHSFHPICMDKDSPHPRRMFFDVVE